MSLLKYFKKGNASLPDPTGPTRFTRGYPFAFGIEMFCRRQLPKWLCIHGGLVSWLQL